MTSKNTKNAHKIMLSANREVLNTMEHNKEEWPLNPSERRRRVWVESSPACTKRVDLDYNLQYMSNAGVQGLRIANVTKFYGKPYPFDFYPESFQNVTSKNMKKAVETGVVITQEAPVVDTEGNELWFHSTITPVNNDEGMVDHLMIVSIDITGRVKAERKLKDLNEILEQRVEARTAELAEANERLQKEICERIMAEEKIHKLSQAIEQSSCIIEITDSEGSIEYVNPRFTALSGFSRKEAMGKNPYILSSDQVSTETYKDLWHTITTGKVWKGEFCNKKKNGELYWVSASISPVKDDKGVITNFIAIKEDITDKKMMKEVLTESEKMKSLGVITAGISHEFNNILNKISGRVQLLEMDYSDNCVLKSELHTIMETIDDGITITDNMLKVARPNKDNSGFVPSDLNELLKQSLEFTKPRWKNMAQARGVDYIIDITRMENASRLLCEPAEIRDVFTSIINNALDAMPGGGSISFETWSKEETLFVSISDTGKGMNEETLNNIFDPFFTTKYPEGAGLGMSIAFGTMTRHGGMIEVESKPGKGSTFTLQFPTTIKKSSRAETPDPKQDINEKSLRILVVDDEEALCNILDKFLSRNGHKVKIAYNGADAIEKIKNEVFDLVLCDLSMPYVNGHTVVDVVNSLENKPKIAIITGHSEGFEPVDGSWSNVDFVLKKPFKLSELAKQINRLFV